MEEVVWRKAGEERCVRSYKPTLAKALDTKALDTKALDTKALDTKTTEKKALPEELKHFAGLCAGSGGLGGVTPQLNKREEASAKMNERYLIGQPIQNPFMPNSNYAADLEAQMNFLTPQQGSH
jgi:hypothetical protein